MTAFLRAVRAIALLVALAALFHAAYETTEVTGHPREVLMRGLIPLAVAALAHAALLYRRRAR